MQIEEQRSEEASKASKVIENRKAAHASLKQLAKEQKSFEAQQKTAQELLAETTAQRKEVTNKVTQLDLEIQELEDGSKQDASEQVGSIS